MSLFENKSVKAVKKALGDAGSGARVVALDKSANTAEGAAKALTAPLGSIVKSMVFMVGDQPVMVLVAGDKRCVPEALPRAFNLEGEVVRASADQVRAATGFAIGGVSPVGTSTKLPTVIDVSLKRFGTVYATAGHPNHIFPTTVVELKTLTEGLISYNITEGEKHHPVKAS